MKSYIAMHTHTHTKKKKKKKHKHTEKKCTRVWRYSFVPHSVVRGERVVRARAELHIPITIARLCGVIFVVSLCAARFESIVASVRSVAAAHFPLPLQWLWQVKYLLSISGFAVDQVVWKGE